MMIRGLLGLVLLIVGLNVLSVGPAQGLTATDRAAAANLQVTNITQGRNPIFDADSDGLADDILLNQHNAAASILRRGGPKGFFTDYFPGTFAKDDRHGCVAADFGSPGNGLPDGRSDLFCTLGSCSGRGDTACGGRIFHRELWLQRATGGFVDEGPLWGVSTPTDRGRDVEVLDADGDGMRDLATAAEGSASGDSLNRLFLNRGGRFEEVLQTPIRRPAGSICVASFVRADGLTDLLYCADPRGTGGSGVLTYRNTGGGAFEDVTSTQAFRTLPARDLELADVTGDGQPDLIVTIAGRVAVWANVNGLFPAQTYTRAVPAAFMTESCDVDRDGDLDLYVATGQLNGANAPDTLLLNAGTGSSFTPFTGLPSTTAGGGDEATCHQTYFGGPAILVANGRFTAAGPYQLIQFKN